ncbi:MAG TPA: hypothetical protein VNO70_24180, partial [Blastocatellia bacterium]|nr:hypothetical protein [Blastocatellia bacterium]
MLTTDVSPQRILKSLPKSRDRAITAERLAEALRLGEPQAARVRQYLAEFARAGLAVSKGKLYWRKKVDGLLIGTLRGTRSGAAFVVPDDERERRFGDLYIADHSMGAAMHGDKVIARVTGNYQAGRAGRVEAVLVRANSTIVGQFVEFRKDRFVAPIDEKFLHNIN